MPVLGNEEGVEILGILSHVLNLLRGLPTSSTLNGSKAEIETLLSELEEPIPKLLADMIREWCVNTISKVTTLEAIVAELQAKLESQQVQISDLGLSIKNHIDNTEQLSQTIWTLEQDKGELQKWNEKVQELLEVWFLGMLKEFDKGTQSQMIESLRAAFKRSQPTEVQGSVNGSDREEDLKLDMEM